MLTLSKKTQVFALAILGGMLFFLGGCSSTPEEPSTSRTTQDVRGDSDRFFQKMEHEEKKE